MGFFFNDDKSDYENSHQDKKNQHNRNVILLGIAVVTFVGAAITLYEQVNKVISKA